MAQDSDLLKLYSKRILALAADLPNTERLQDPDATAKKRSPLCGSTVTVDLNVKDGKIADYAQDVKACALGQASASVVSQNILGLNFAEVSAGRDALYRMLKEEGSPPAEPFDGLEALLPARDFKNRHASILLTFDAILDALKTVEAGQTA